MQPGNKERLILPAVLFIFLSACSQLATIKNVTPVAPVATGSGSPASETEQKQNPEAALASDLDVAAKAWADLKRNPADTQAKQLYNYSVARVVSLFQSTGKLPKAGAIAVGTGSRGYRLAFKSDVKAFDDPAESHFVPADELAVSGRDFADRVRRDGIGAPVLAEIKSPLAREREKAVASDRLFYGMTALLEFEGSQVRLHMKDPLATETISIGDHRYPLAADFSVASAAMLAINRPQRLGFIRMIRPAKYAYTARLVVLQPYDPNKIPLLMIHGLQDTPATWAPLINKLRADAEINRRYQLWVYSYPSGYPFPYSAMLLREELDRIEKLYPHHKKIVLIGHSMGGLVSRLMVTDARMTFWTEFFGKPPEQIPMSPEDKQLFVRALVFEHRPDVSQVIFISTPHRGSGFASNWIGRIGIALVKLPINMIKLGASASQYVISPNTAGQHLSAQKVKRLRFPTSIDTLSPQNRFVRTLNKLPISDHIPYYSIMGDRGRGDTPNSSDGVVPYWSSHLDGAQSERIVPSGHPAHQNKQGMEEVDRILKVSVPGK